MFSIFRSVYFFFSSSASSQLSFICCTLLSNSTSFSLFSVDLVPIEASESPILTSGNKESSKSPILCIIFSKFCALVFSYEVSSSFCLRSNSFCSALFKAIFSAFLRSVSSKNSAEFKSSLEPFEGSSITSLRCSSYSVESVS